MINIVENEQLVCTVDSHGCEIKSVKDRKTGKEYMWNGDPAYWNRTSPVLFPFVGAVKDKEYRHNGKTYSIGQHGFARDMEFSLLSDTRRKVSEPHNYSILNEKTEEEMWMELSETDETLAKYPFRFRLEIGYRLVGRTLSVMWRVINTNETDMYFAIGAHPGFMLPAEDGCAFRLYDTKGNPVDSVKNRIFGTGGCVTDNTVTVETPEGKLPITGELFDGDALVIEDSQLGRVDIIPAGSENPDSSVISVEFTSPLVGLWSPPHKNAPFVCIEPWYGRCDSESFGGDLKDREYEQTLKPGEDFRAEYTITFGI